MEAELMEVLEQYGASTCLQAYRYLDENKVEHPECFIEPIIKSFSTMIPDMKEGIASAYKGGAFDVGPLLRVLEGQFNGSIPVFKPYILKLQEAMETPPAENRRYGDAAKSNEELYTYREEVKDWLARH